MPAGFGSEPDDARYQAAYFERFANSWTHGDFAELTPRGGLVIHGRSDAVLNPSGVRIGTAELYAVVETQDEVVEAIAVGQDWQGDQRILLFVVLRDGISLDEALGKRLRNQIRARLSPRHVPAEIRQVAAIPRTRSGKIVELAVADVIQSLSLGTSCDVECVIMDAISFALRERYGTGKARPTEDRRSAPGMPQHRWTIIDRRLDRFSWQSIIAQFSSAGW